MDLLGTNPSPQLQTQVPLGSGQAFSFVVFGDWGQVDATGTNPAQANLMTQIAKSGAALPCPQETTATPQVASRTTATA